MDLKLYNLVNRDVQMDRSELQDTPAFDLEVIANRVVKFLLTSYGSDALNPEYGGRAFITTQFSEAYIPKFRLDLDEDLRRCTEYIRSTSRDEEKLLYLILKDIEYDKSLMPGRVDVYIELITNKNNRALLNVSTNK